MLFFLKIIFSLILILILSFLFWPVVYKAEFSWEQYLKYSFYINWLVFSVHIVKTENSRASELKILGLKTGGWPKKNKKKRELKVLENAESRIEDSKTVQKSAEAEDNKEVDHEETTKKEDEKTDSARQKAGTVDSIKNIKAKIKRYHRLFSRANIEHLARFGGRLLYLLKPDFIELNFLLGCSDPYYNGLLLAVYYSIKNSWSTFPLNLCINWEQEVMVGSGKIKGKIIPVQVVRVLLSFVFSCRSYHLFKQLYQWKRKTKKEGGD